MKKTVLVTGGAGYIGSIAVRELVKAGHEVLVVDNLSKGILENVSKDAQFFLGDLCNKPFLEEIFSKNKVDSIMHFAGYKAVGESMENAAKYSDNIKGTLNLLTCMVKHDVEQIIYSSSAAVYGMPRKKVIDEGAETKPINYYGYTKLACEDLIKWYSKIHGIKYCALRYFNVAGDGGLNYIDPEAQNILPIIMEVLFGTREKLSVFGNDYKTKDGTCVRDYIHVLDLVDAHILALGLKKSEVINLGTSEGCSVKELIEGTRKVTGKKINFEYAPRRAGDPASLTASNEKARKKLKWNPKRGIEEMIGSTYKAYLAK